MRELQNVLYVTTQGVTLRLEHEAVKVMADGEMVARFPLMTLAGIFVFGGAHVTSSLIHRCAEEGRTLVWLTRSGRFRARLQGPTRGNVLLRRAQHLTLSDEGDTAAIARQIVAGKIQNCRQVVLRGARDAVRDESRMRLTKVGEALGSDLVALEKASQLEVIRGLEGIAASRYFGCFSEFINIEPQEWTTGGRHRRPPRDRLNAVLSFLYALLRAECEAALEGVGLDPQVGFLHSLRPGRPGLALDLMEELRPLVDRLTVTMINRRQLSAADFEHHPGGAVYLSETGRRAVITAWQRRKEVDVPHRTLNNQVPLVSRPLVTSRYYGAVFSTSMEADHGTAWTADGGD